MAEYGFFIVEILYFIFGIITIFTTIKNWNLNKNRMLIAVTVYISSVLVRSIIDMGVYALGFDINVTVAGTLDIGMIMGFMGLRSF